MNRQPPFSVLTIAGSDSSGGAGIQADIKAISATGCYAASVITALTAQNTLGVQTIYPLPAEFIKEQLHSVLSDLTFHAIKMGMLYDESIISVIASQLHQLDTLPVILDPVMVSKNGCALLPEKMINSMIAELFPLATLVTPNRFEAEKLTGIIIRTEKDQQAAAISLGEKYHINVLVKGGHLENSYASDVLYLHQQKSCHWFRAERIQTNNTHGTGCTLSSAIASFLAQKMDLVKAISAAKTYLSGALRASPFFNIGHGHGPVDHFHFLKEVKHE